MKPIVLFGIKHAGKSSIGKYLAQELQFTWIDSDYHLAERARQERREGKLLFIENLDSLSDIQIIRAIIANLGETEFRDRERTTIQEVFSSGENRLVLSTGGGVCDNQPAMETIQSQAWCVYLSVPEEILFQRIVNGGYPTWMDKSYPHKSFHELYKRRDPYYRSVADVTIELGNKPLEEVQKIVLEKVKEQY